MRRVCSNCGTAITRMSRTGKCFDCYHKSGETFESAAERGSAMLRDAVLALHKRQTA